MNKGAIGIVILLVSILGIGYFTNWFQKFPDWIPHAEVKVGSYAVYNLTATATQRIVYTSMNTTHFAVEIQDMTNPSNPRIVGTYTILKPYRDSITGNIVLEGDQALFCLFGNAFDMPIGTTVELIDDHGSRYNFVATEKGYMNADGIRQYILLNNMVSGVSLKALYYDLESGMLIQIHYDFDSWKETVTLKETNVW